jgi:hypothetical protein
MWDAKMKRNNSSNKIILVIFTIVTACVHASVKKEESIKIVNVESILLGSSNEQVVKAIGEPAQKDHLKYHGRDETVFYYFTPGSSRVQRAALSFDSKSGKLVSKLFVPRENEPESHLQFLLEGFKNSTFSEIEFPICGKHFSEDSALKVDMLHGLEIRFRKTQRDVETITWQSPQDLKLVVQSVQTCSKSAD